MYAYFATMDIPNMKTKGIIFIITLLWGVTMMVCVIATLRHPSIICNYLPQQWYYHNYLPIHTREYQAFCAAFDNNIQKALSILYSLQQSKLNTQQSERINYNIALLSEQMTKKSLDTTLESEEKRSQWKTTWTNTSSPHKQEHNTITVESKVQYQGIDQDWINQEQEKLIIQQLNRDTYIPPQKDTKNK